MYISSVIIYYSLATCFFSPLNNIIWGFFQILMCRLTSFFVIAAESLRGHFSVDILIFALLKAMQFASASSKAPFHKHSLINFSGACPFTSKCNLGRFLVWNSFSFMLLRFTVPLTHAHNQTGVSIPYTLLCFGSFCISFHLFIMVIIMIIITTMTYAYIVFVIF